VQSPRLISPASLSGLPVATEQRPRLISSLSLAGLTLAVGIVLVLLYPQQRISDQIRKNIKVDEISLQYIKNLLATEPDNYELRLQLAQSYASVGQYENAYAALQPLYTNTQARWREEAWLVKLDILLKIAYSATPGSPDRKQKMAQFLRELRASESQFTHPNAFHQFARTAETGSELQLAESIATRFILSSDSLIDLDEAARLALANGRYLESAQFTWRARQLTRNAGEKIAYLKLALATLQAGGIGHMGLEWVQQLPESEWQSTDMLYSLTKLALASNQPVSAADFASRLLGFDHPLADPYRFNSAHYELAYSAFLGNRDLPHGLKLAQIAVSQQPDNVIWRDRLAHIAEWSGQPQLAMVHWRWLAIHQGKESDWENWMRLATDLFDYDAQITGLERDWKLNEKNEQYARKIVQRYEQLGQPEEALAWLDRNGNEAKNPQLLLLSAELLTRMGRETEALARYRRYLSRQTANPELAATIAAMLQRAGLYQEAFNVLKRSQSRALPESKLFWTNLGELAWILKQYDEAAIAYRILSDAPDAELNHQVRLFQVLKQNDQRLAAKTAEQYWLKNGRIDLFINAVETYAALKDSQAVQRLYKLTETPKWREYDNNLRFVSLRAEMHKNSGNYAAAEHDYQILTANYPGDLVLKESYLWLLIDAHKLNQLDVLMQRWAKLLPGTPNLWDAFAAGHLVLGRPNQALILYERMAKAHAQDELWQLNFAATLESNGQIKRAGQIRNQIWQQRRNKKTGSDWLNTGASANDIEALRLLLLNDPALGQGVLWKLLRDGSPELKQNSQFVELATVWLNDHDQNDAARAWLIRQYARRLNTSP
jgi:predicted Zn-dependent protease